MWREQSGSSEHLLPTDATLLIRHFFCTCHEMKTTSFNNTGADQPTPPHI